MYLLLSVLLIGIGLLMVWKPALFFEITEGWRTNGSPSDAYLRSTRFGGAMFLLAGIGGAVVLLFFT
ncbi:DUF6199 family natural product biosynthesis protein [uncultured Oscillibacter sp.]|uniref:DUF6199 family natural product biosynthesis protein n=1 Tax=uncultured Oscillibacter sp. TaxID=876091 RepID=UPI00263217A0|nr:DUF6199 family natural product biosynthesis protein [uncultured Oscillibacter sp.]